MFRKIILNKSFALLVAVVFILAIGAGAKVLINNKKVVVQENQVKHDQVNSDIKFKTEIIELTNDVGQNYFVNYRIKREQFREEAKEMLQPLLESDIRTTREEAQTQWLKLSKRIVAEGEIENVLKMQGLIDVVSEVNTSKVSITVLAKELKTEEIRKIKYTVATITGLSQEKIEVMARA